MKTRSVKSAVSLVLMLSVMLTAIGVLTPRVNADGNKPNAPTGLEWQGNTATWQQVDEATDYTVCLWLSYDKKETKSVMDPSYDFSNELDYHGNGVYKFSVTAKNSYGSSEEVFSSQMFYVINGCIAVSSLTASITEPEVGQTPATTAVSGDAAKYSVSVDSWYKGGGAGAPGAKMSESDVFEPGETYIVELKFTPQAGYVFNTLSLSAKLNEVQGLFCATQDNSKYCRFVFTTPSESQHTVTFSNNWGNGNYKTSIVEDGETVSQPADPTYDGGIEFLGWYTDLDFTTEFDFDTPITEDITLYPRWKCGVKVEIVTLDKDGDNVIPSEISSTGSMQGLGGNGSINKTEAAAGEKVKVTGATPAEGYELVRVVWTDGATDCGAVGVGEEFSMPNYSCNVEFVFQEIDDRTEYPVVINLWSRDQYDLTIYPGGTGGTVETNKTTLKPGQTINITVTPDPGFTVTKISIGDGYQDFSTPVLNDSTAQFTVPDDWYSASGAIQVDVLLKANSSISTSAFTLIGYGSFGYTYSAINGAEFKYPDYPENWSVPAGKHFAGWSLTDGNVTNEIINLGTIEFGSYTVDGDAEFTAIFKNWITGWTDTGAGGVEEDGVGNLLRIISETDAEFDVTAGEEVTLEIYLKDGYVFDNDGLVEVIGSDGTTVLTYAYMTKYGSNSYRGTFTMPNEDVSLKFATTSANKTVTFDSKGGSTVTSQTVAHGSKATKPADPTKSGYTFVGWYTNSACTTAYDFNTAVTADITLYAKWTAVSTTPAPTTPAPTPEPIETPKLTTGIAHVQDIGDVSVAVGSDGVLTIGTTGMGKRLEQITINFENNTPYSGTLQYRVHVQNIGWMEWTDAGQKCGTEGQSLRIEAIEIRFTGELADYYSVEYCVHIQDYGDMQGWVKDGALAGTTGESKRIEELKIRIVPKNSGSSMSVKYRVHVQDYGWEKSYATNGAMSGTSGESKRLEGIELFLSGTQYSGGIKYKTHVQDYGWQGWSYDGEMSGTQGESKRLEGICIELYGEIADYYDIYYRVHAQDIGWMAWAKNGECAGTAGRSARLEGIQIVLVPKGEPAPGATYEGITAVTDKAFVEGF